MNNLSQLSKIVTTLKTGDSGEVKKARLELKNWFKIEGGKPTNDQQVGIRLIVTELQNLDEIEAIDRQVILIGSLKMIFLYYGSEHFDDFAEFIIKYIQYPNGKIRQSILSLAEWLMMSLSIKDEFDQEKLSEAKKVKCERDLKNFCHIVEQTENLMRYYEEPKFNRYKYVSSLPAGIYKSLMKLLVETLLRSEFYENIYKKYQSDQRKREIPDLEQVLPQLKLKYTKLEKDGKRVTFEGTKCSKCKKKDISVGAGFLDKNKKEQIICEDCTIDRYFIDHRFKTREAAASRRRRIFDVGYLLAEIMLDKFMEAYNLKSLDEINEDEFMKMNELAKLSYNTFFTKEEKWDLENEPDQQKIRNVLAERLNEAME